MHDPIIVDLDKQWMDSRPHGVLTVPVYVTGSWKLTIRIWVGCKLLVLAAWVMNLGVDVEPSGG
jgi:hypothetical protein